MSQGFETSDTQKLNEINDVLREKFASGDDTLVKEAAQSLNDYTRRRIRSAAYCEQVIEPVTPDKFDRTIDSRVPGVIFEMEPDVNAAATVSLRGGPSVTQYLNTGRYRVDMDRIWTPRFITDTAELRTDEIDLRQVVSDNAVREISTKMDMGFTAAATAIVGPSADAANISSGIAQWRTIHGGITREGLKEGAKLLPRTPYSLSTACMVTNNVTIHELLAFPRGEGGGDISQDLLTKGVQAIPDLLGTKTIVTPRKEVIPTGTIFHFASEEYLGRILEFCPVTLVVDSNGPFIEMVAYREIGMAIANPQAVGRADYTNVE